MRRRPGRYGVHDPHQNCESRSHAETLPYGRGDAQRGADTEDDGYDDRLIARILNRAIPTARGFEHLQADTQREQRGGEHSADGEAHVAHHSTREGNRLREADRVQTSAAAESRRLRVVATNTPYRTIVDSAYLT